MKLKISLAALRAQVILMLLKRVAYRSEKTVKFYLIVSYVMCHAVEMVLLGKLQIFGGDGIYLGLKVH